jgi:hypothetical protein
MPLCRKAVFTTFAFCSILVLVTGAIAQDGSSTGKCGFQNLIIPSPAGTTTLPTALNDNGAIVGTLSSGTGTSFHTTGFLFSGGQFTHFRFPGSANTSPHDMNKNGVIVGAFEVTGGSGQRAFQVHAGNFSEVKIPGFPNAPAVAQGVNDLGDIVGAFNGNGTDFGFLLHQGKLTTISFPGATGGTFPSSINNQGVVVGTYSVNEQRTGVQGFMWKNGAFTNIQFPGADATFPVKISNNGDIVGTYVESGTLVIHGFSFENGRYTTINRPGFNETQIVALNGFDNVLGVGSSSTGQTWFKGFCSAVF